MIEFLLNKKSKFKQKAAFTPTPILLLLLSFLVKFFMTSLRRVKKTVFFFINIFCNKKTTAKLVSGFTLVELLVTISIFVVVTGVVLLNSNQFDNTILLNNFAYDLALTIKQAQSYGVNIKENVGGGFDSYYGVYFDNRVNGSNASYILFDYASSSPSINYSQLNIKQSCTDFHDMDINGNNAHPGLCVQKYTMRKGVTIKEICVGEKSDNCDLNPDQFVVAFIRPKLEAKILAPNKFGDSPQKYMRIILSSANGATSTVVVTQPGQVYIKK